MLINTIAPTPNPKPALATAVGNPYTPVPTLVLIIFKTAAAVETDLPSEIFLLSMVMKEIDPLEIFLGF